MLGNDPRVLPRSPGKEEAGTIRNQSGGGIAMSAVYESGKVLSEYLLFHFGSDSEVLPDEGQWPEGMKEALGFAARTPAWFSEGKVSRGLDLGCAVGRSAFEMAADCGEVVGIDFSHAFIAA